MGGVQVTELMVGVGLYLLLGLVSLAVLDLRTKRIRERLREASYDTQAMMVAGTRTAIVVTVLALWLFWPFAVYGAVEDRLRSKKKE
ncbi:hypothetical protein LCGC14_3070950 [marine sediment metagenome]|uniref:Uncharacterized protein n=1 Tax=marine sediment metagenome TaxID=412755 RepID=A0A0F8YNQ3_9ZZZZ